MISGLWNKVRLVCGNHHDEPQNLIILQTDKDAFYVCPKYNPLNRTESDRVCMNRISVQETEKILNILSDKIIEAEDQGQSLNLTHYRFETRVGRYQVLRHTPDELVISAYNKKQDFHPAG